MILGKGLSGKSHSINTSDHSECDYTPDTKPHISYVLLDLRITENVEA